MRKLKSLLFVFAGLLVVAGAKASIGKLVWSTVDNPPLTSPGGYPWNMTTDQHGNLYASGSDNVTCEIRKSDPHGMNWKTVDSYQLTPSQTQIFGGGAAVGGRSIYMGCQVNDASQVNHWIVRKSTDEGATWVTALDYAVPAQYGYSEMRSIAADSWGHVYVAGGYGDLVNYHISFWQTLGSSDHGKTWKQLDNFSGPGGLEAFGAGMNLDRWGNVYVVGIVGKPAPQAPCGGSLEYQIMRKSTDHGKTWKTYDGFLGKDQCVDLPVSIRIDRWGILYAPGVESVTNSDGSFKNSAYMRVSYDGGGHWINIDYQFELPGSTYTEAYSAEISADGKIFESGHGVDAKGVNNWYVRVLTHSGWKISDLYTGPAGLGARSNDLIFDNFGHLYATGYYNASPTTIGWAVRKADYHTETESLGSFDTLESIPGGSFNQGLTSQSRQPLVRRLGRIAPL